MRLLMCIHPSSTITPPKNYFKRQEHNIKSSLLPISPKAPSLYQESSTSSTFAFPKKSGSISKAKWKIQNLYGPAKLVAIKEQAELAESVMELYSVSWNDNSTINQRHILRLKFKEHLLTSQSSELNYCTKVRKKIIISSVSLEKSQALQSNLHI